MKKVLKLPVGIEDFQEIRLFDFYYVDKTKLIEQLLEQWGKVNLFTRPRRFGKTLAMRMLANFFEICRESHYMIKDQVITKEEAICAQWQNQWPVLFLSFKDIDGVSFENALDMFRFTLSQLCITHAYLEESPYVNGSYKETFQRLKNRSSSLTDIKGAILILMSMLRDHHRKPVILLLDENDVTKAKAASYGYYAEKLEVIKAIKSTSLKDNTALRFAVVTGCLKIA